MKILSKIMMLSTGIALSSLANGAFAQSVISIDRSTSLGVIEPEVYGQFVEHLGAGIYDGLWVGKDSNIPNTDGIRDDVFMALKDLSVPVMRWPGGCFADYYRWRDGTGDLNERPVRINVNWGGAREANQFGTHEFFNLAERLGSKTYLNVNLGTGTVGEAKDWLEYITFDADAGLANERRENGRIKPWVVDYLSVGNETWGCGGNLRPGAYADLYTQYMTFAKTANKQPVRIISGSHDGNIEYSDEILDHPALGSLAEGISVHFYTLPTSDWSDKGPATGFQEDQWASTIQRSLRIDDIIKSQLAMIDSKNVGDDFKLYVDEWGMWTNQEEGAADGSLYQQNSIRDSVVAAIHLNAFHEHAKHVPMTNIAQMVNVLQAMILTDGPDMILTPTYHVYEMYKPFQGATSLSVSVDSPTYTYEDISYDAINVSAATNSDGLIIISLVNTDPVNSQPIIISDLSGAVQSSRVLSGESMDAHNTFEDQENVVPKELSVDMTDDGLRATLPAHSVSVLLINP